MSASKILEKLLRKGKITPVPQTSAISQRNEQPQTPRLKSQAGLAPSDRPVDPVVARLKAARKAEREQKERELREKKGLGPKRPPSNKPKFGPRQPLNALKQASRLPAQRVNPASKSRTGHGGSNRLASAPPTQVHTHQHEKKPKMSFGELMAKASTIDQSKMSIALKQKTKSAEVTALAPRHKTPSQESRPAPGTRKLHSTNASGRGKPVRGRNISGDSLGISPQRRSLQTGLKPIQAKAPHPMRQPSTALAEKLKQKPKGKSAGSKKFYDEEDDEDSEDMDSFIVSEDEEMEQDEPDYDRDEIWSIFNRGKKRSHYSYDDYDSDDMEATGAEILEEESRSKRNAVLEDQREMEKEAKLAALKRARKSGMKR